MIKIILSILILISHINADIIYLTIIKEGNTLEIEHIITDNNGENRRYPGTEVRMKPVPKDKIREISIGDFWKENGKTVYQYKHFQILNKHEIKKAFIAEENNMKIIINEKNYMQVFRFKTIPNKEIKRR